MRGRNLWKSCGTLHVWWSYRNWWIDVSEYLEHDSLDCSILSQNGRNTLPWHTVAQLVTYGWCGWITWNFKPIARLNVSWHNMVKWGFMCLKQNWKLILTISEIETFWTHWTIIQFTDYPYRILIIGGSRSGRTNVLLNMKKHQRQNIDNFFL